MAHKFFDEMSEQSDVKATIVSKYFYAWAGVMIPQAEKRSKRIAYIDLFAGPGRYKDGKMSTPLRILEHAINHEKMKDMLVTIFNDVDSDHSKILEKEISQCQGIGCLKHAPVVYNEEVGTNIAEKFEEMELIPTLFFIDPWGYKGLSLRLVNSVLKDWGCECIFFFNYNRINMGIRNPIVKAHMDALFGEDRAEMPRENDESLSPTERELAIVEELAEAIRDMGGKFILPFAFKNADGKRT
ncbi:MAG: three-Cys-motif partner protein TcmP, partial [Thermodesulfobacteriota bacterium]